MRTITSPAVLSLLLAGVVVSGFAALNAQTVKTPAKPVITAQKSSSSSSAAAKGKYVVFNPLALGNGQVSVLYFHASWCPICKSFEGIIKGWYAKGEIPLSMYRVDYDTAKELKSRYKVTYQHTFVKIDGRGKTIKLLQSPSEQALKAFLLK